MKTKILRNALTTVNLLAALSVAVCALVQGSTVQQTPQHHTYQLIDLGTLGGPKSYQSENGPEDQIINDAGVVGFTADTAVPDPYAPNCFVDCFVSHATRWENGVLTDLGALPGNGNSSASSTRS